MRKFIVALLVLVALSACDFDDAFFRTEEQDPVTDPRIGEEFSFTSHDSTEIHGLYLRSEAQPKATIYLFHGSGENIASWEEIAEPLVAASYDVVMMDYRGFGRSEGIPTHSNAISDAAEMVRFVENRTRSTARFLMGQSYGGQVAIRLAYDQPDNFHGLIIEGTFTSHREQVMASVPAWLKPIIGLITVSPYEARGLIKEVTIPKLIIHSRDDQIVPPWMGRALYEAAAGQKEYWETGGRHALGLLEVPESYVATVDVFIAAQTTRRRLTP